jgi:cell division septum initiation protein DivIVA
MKMNNRIEQMINELEEYLTNCRFQPLSTSKIIVNKDEIDELISDLRAHIPEEVEKCQQIIADKDAILADAQVKADKIIEAAYHKSDKLVSEHEISKKAYEHANAVVADASDRSQQMVADASDRAQKILDDATKEANELRVGAVNYTSSLMTEVEEAIDNSLRIFELKSEDLVNTLRSSYNIIRSNRTELENVGNDSSYAENEADAEYSA